MKLLVQSDDYGFTDAVTDGILKGIQQGIIRNTGLFVNMPSSARAASLIKELPGISVGIDINLVAGYPVSDSSEVPHLLQPSGHFLTSLERKEIGKPKGSGMFGIEYEQDPFHCQETLKETDNQVKRFIELMGRKPDYIHPHSIMSPNSVKAMLEIAKRYDLFVSFQAMRSEKIKAVPCDWTPKPFSIEDQLKTDVEENLIESLKTVLEAETAMFVCHAGHVDHDLLKESSYTIIRTKDLAAMTSIKVKQFIEEHRIELITYKEIKEMEL